jgi:hypothetical protein
LLATQNAVAISAFEGTVTSAPSIRGVATNLFAAAVTGNSSTISIAIEQHP